MAEHNTRRNMSDGEARDSLARSVNSLVKIFEEASKDLKMDTKDAVLVSEKLDNILKRLEILENHNEKIARGIVAIADMLEEQGLSKSAEKKEMPVSDSPPKSSGTKQLPSYNLPENDRKKTFLNFKT